MRLRAVAVLIAALTVSVLVVAGAQTAIALPSTRTWTGNGTTNNWSEAANWDTGVPVAGDSLVFPSAASRKTNSNDLAADTSFENITLNGSGYVINGNPVSLATDLTNEPSSGSNEIALTLNGPGEIFQQGGTLILSANNGYTGSTHIVAGPLVALSDSSLGDAAGETFVGTDAALQLRGGIDLGDEVVNVGGTGLDDEGEIQSQTGTNRIGTVKLFGPTVIGVGNSTLVISVLTINTSGAGLTLVGGGKLQVESSFLAGLVDIADGNLTWNASSQAFVTDEEHGWLRGTGMVSDATVQGGLIWPGSGNAPGILRVFGPTTFNAGSFRVDIDGDVAGTGYGQLATGSISLNPLATILEIDLTIEPTAGDVYRIIDNTGGTAVQGTFLDLPEGAVFTENGYVWEISYKGGTGNDVTLTVLRHTAADLHLQMTATPSPAVAGENIVYTVTVMNAGPDPSITPTISLGTPVGTSFVSASGPDGWTCSNPSPGPTVRCSGSKIEAGELLTLTLTFKVNAGSSGTISATAGVSAVTPDPFSTDNSATLLTPIGPADPHPFKRYVIMVARD